MRSDKYGPYPWPHEHAWRAKAYNFYVCTICDDIRDYGPRPAPSQSPMVGGHR